MTLLESIHEGDSLAMPNPLVALIEDPYLVKEDFFAEERECLTLSE